MTEGKHTPGPWRIAGKGTIRKGNHDWIADVHWRNREANARLIAAAPELLALAIAYRDLIKSDYEGRGGNIGGGMREAYETCSAVISKATGAS